MVGKIHAHAETLLDSGICYTCGDKLEIYVGENHFDSRVESCGNIVCSKCESGVIVMNSGIMYYFERRKFIRGEMIAEKGLDIYEKIKKY